MAETENQAHPEGSLLSHLLELRNRLLYCIVVILIAFGALVPFAKDLYALLARPLIDIPGVQMVAIDVVSPFLTPIKLTFAVAIVVTVPFLLYQLWAFVAPGLYRNERRFMMPLLVSSTLLFYGGMAFAYYFVFPAAFKLFAMSAPAGVSVTTDIRSYLDFVFSLFFAFGITFEVPIATILLVKTGFVRPETLSAKRSYVILGVFIIAAVLTPPDVMSQFLLAIPMWLLFEVGLFLSYRMRGKDTSEYHELTEQEMEAELDAHERDNPADKDRD